MSDTDILIAQQNNKLLSVWKACAVWWLTQVLYPLDVTCLADKWHNFSIANFYSN
jgi:hypothetical protein